MISIVTAYYNRKKLFYRTLVKLSESEIKNFEVIAVDDGSSEDQRLEDLQKEFCFLKVVRIEKEDKWYVNPCIPFNLGFKKAIGDIIIIQNPECLHFGDILDYVNKNLKKNEYISFSCYSLSKESTDNLDLISINDAELKNHFLFNHRIVKFDGDDGWYNHTLYRPVAFHFCSAMFKEDLEDLGGFDERYALGIAYDDTELLYRIKQKGMKVRIVDSPIVLHQNHYSAVTRSTSDDLKKKAEHENLMKRNLQFLHYVTQSKKPWRVNILNHEKEYTQSQTFREIINKVLSKLKKNYSSS